MKLIRKYLVTGLLALSAFSVTAPDAFGFFWRWRNNSCGHHHGHGCEEYSTYICCKPYNAFSPVCFGNMTCTGCCPPLNCGGGFPGNPCGGAPTCCSPVFTVPYLACSPTLACVNCTPCCVPAMPCAPACPPMACAPMCAPACPPMACAPQCMPPFGAPGLMPPPAFAPGMAPPPPMFAPPPAPPAYAPNPLAYAPPPPPPYAPGPAPYGPPPQYSGPAPQFGPGAYPPPPPSQAYYNGHQGVQQSGYYPRYLMNASFPMPYSSGYRQ